MSANGKNYYVIGSGDTTIIAAAVVNTIAERNALTAKGFCFVRNAYRDDPTVNAGWAMYLSVEDASNPNKSSWIKIVEQESVDGPWGAGAEILKNLVSRTEFQQALQAIGQGTGGIDLTDYYNKTAVDNLLKNKVSCIYDETTGKVTISLDTELAKTLVCDEGIKSVPTGKRYGEDSVASTGRKGWYIKAINNANFNSQTLAGTIDVYVSATQVTADVAKANNIATAYDNSVVTGFVQGYMVCIRNGETFVDVAKIESVNANKIVLGEIKRNFLNTTLVYRKTLDASPISGKTYYLKSGNSYVLAGSNGTLTGFVEGTEYYEQGNPLFIGTDKTEYQLFNEQEEMLPPGCPVCGQTDEWSISMTRIASGLSATPKTTSNENGVDNVGSAKLTKTGGSFGWNNLANGLFASAFGCDNVVLGYNSVVIGNGLYNPINNCLVTGTYNTLPNLTGDDPYRFVVGIGKSNAERKDGFRVNSDGTVYVNKVSVESVLTATSRKLPTIINKLNTVLHSLGATGAVSTASEATAITKLNPEANPSYTETDLINKINEVIDAVNSIL